jgi:hypothetical protein
VASLVSRGLDELIHWHTPRTLERVNAEAEATARFDAFSIGARAREVDAAQEQRLFELARPEDLGGEVGELGGLDELIHWHTPRTLERVNAEAEATARFDAFMFLPEFAALNSSGERARASRPASGRALVK